MQDVGGLNLDARAPVITPGAPPITRIHDPTIRASVDGVSVLGDTAIASIGTRVNMSGLSVDNDPSTLEWNLEEFVNGAAWQNITASSVSREFVIGAPGSPGPGGLGTWRSIPGEVKNIKLRADDGAGNQATQAVVPVTVDNVVPDPTSDFNVRNSLLTRAPTSASVRTGFVGAGASFARIHVNIEGAATPIVRYAATVDTPVDITLPALADAYATGVNVTLYPVDGAGNVNLAPSIVRSPAFPHGITLAYGGTPEIPQGIAGNAIKNLYVNVTSNSPSISTTTPDGSDFPVYGELLRQRVGLAPVYWVNGTAGSDPDLDDAGSTGHFRATENLEPDVASDTTRTTAFKPVVTSTTTGSFVMTNLSARAFIDSPYQLLVHLKGTNGHATRVVRDILVDGVDPGTGAHRNFTKGLPATTSGPIHGTDGNPLRVAINMTDWRTTGTGASFVQLDSGLRNVSVELITADASTRVLNTSRASTLPLLDRAARVNITRASCNGGNPAADAAAGLVRTGLLPYCHDLTDWTDAIFATFCPAPATSWNATCIAYDEAILTASHRGIAQTSTPLPAPNQTLTFINKTAFMGWVNLTMPELPAGSYKVRVVATDNVGRPKAETYGANAGDLYKVAPAVRLLTTATFPRVTEDGKLEFSVYSGQRFAAPQPFDVVEKCVAGATPGVTDVCPAQRVKIYVSNSDTAAEGVLYVTLTNFDKDGRRVFTDNPGWTTVDPVNGTLAAGNRQLELFPNVSFFAPTIASVPGGNTISLTQPVYVRAVAEAVDGSISNATSWIRAVSLTQPSLRVNAPAIVRDGELFDWQLNRSGDRPLYNISIDRKQDTPAPKLTWWLYNASVPFTPGTANSWALKSDNLSVAGNGPGGSVAPKVVFNWSGRLEGAGSAALPVGDYRLDAIIYDASSTTSGLLELGTTSRLFSIVGAQSTDLGDISTATGIAKRGSLTFVAREFDLPFTINHGAANVTSASQIAFKLVRTVSAGSQASDIAPGTDGFTVTLRADSPLDDTSQNTSFTARVVLPNGADNGASYRLNITTAIDHPPYTFGNMTKFFEFAYDNQPPSGALLVAQTEATVVDLATLGSGGVARDLASPTPTLQGFAEDIGSGIKNVEVRMYDITLGRTVRLTANTTVPGLAEEWASSEANPAIVILGNDLSNNGRRFWSIPLTGRGSAEDLWGANWQGVIDFTHKYRVDVRVTDNLTKQPSVFNSTFFDFDAAPPTLGYQNRLGVPASFKSGISSAVVQVPWHGSARLTVTLTDNQCIGAVRLVGLSDSAPANSTPIKVNMTPQTSLAASDARRTCNEKFPPENTVGGIRRINYSLDLRDAPVLTDIIGNYTYWFEAEDALGQTSEVPANFRTFRMQVLDKSPASILSYSFDPNPGQAGGRTLVRADVFDNLGVSHVDVQFRWANGSVITTGRMRAENVSAAGVGRYVLDTQDDLNLTLVAHNYTVNLTAYDINWNRTVAAGGSTCDPFCVGVFPIYVVGEGGGAPVVVLESPPNGATVNATPVFKIRALSRSMVQGDVRVVAGAAGSEAAVSATNLTFNELLASNGTRQGYTVTYAPPRLTDATNFSLNVSVSVGGLSNASAFSFRVDALPPTVSANVTGTVALANKTYAVAATRVTLAALDNVSTATALYSVNGGPQQTYAGTITPSGSDGEWKLEYWASDAAGNIAPKQTITLNIDKTGPRVSVGKHGDELLLTVTDAGVGLNESSVVVHYRYGEAISFVTKSAERVTGNTFSALLPGNATETGLAYYFTAEDVLGNAGGDFTASAPYTIERSTPGGETPPPSDLPPTISITSPGPQETVRGVAEIRWLAEDPESKLLSITIALRDPAPGKVLSAGGENSGVYRLDVSNYSTGAYTIVITASDGVNSATDTATFNVVSTPRINPIVVPPPNVQADQPVNFGVSIDAGGTSVARASYRVLKDGQPYTQGLLTPSAAGGYGATFTPTDSGQYRVLVDVTYADGKQDTGQQVAAFRVQGGAEEPVTKVFPGSLIALVAIAALLVVLAAYGAFGRWRK